MHKFEGFKGCLLIVCEACGRASTFYTKQHITRSRCNYCRHVTVLPKEDSLKMMPRAYKNCECGDRTIFRTNAKAKLFEITCHKCGYIVTLEKRKEYVSI